MAWWRMARRRVARRGLAWSGLAWSGMAWRRVAGEPLGSWLGLARLGMGNRRRRRRRRWFASVLVQQIWLGALPLGLSLSISPSQ